MISREVSIAGRVVGNEYPTYFVAESLQITMVTSEGPKS